MPQRPDFTPGVLIADGLAELVESQMDELGPLGLTLTGIAPLVTALKALGADHPFTIHGLDAFARNLIRLHVNSPPTREFLIAFSDAYFDRMKSVAADANRQQVERAQGQAIQKASAVLTEFIKKQKTKPTFASLLTKLDEADQVGFNAWASGLNEEDGRRWTAYKAHIASLDELKSILAKDPAVRLSFCELLYAKQPTVLETLAAAARGEATPATQALQVRLDRTGATLRQGTADSRARAQAIRDRNR